MRLLYTAFLLFIFSTCAFSQSWYTGRTAVCLGDSLNMSDGLTIMAGGVWTSSNIAIVQVGSMSGIAQGISMGTATLTYNFGSNSFSITMGVGNAIPPHHTLSFGSSSSTICRGTPESDLVLYGSDTQVYYQLMNHGAYVGSELRGTGANLDFGMQIAYADSFYVMGTDFVSGCSSLIGSTPTHILESPTPISGYGNVICRGGSTTFYNSMMDGGWTSSNHSVGVINRSTGLFTGVNIGTTTITYTAFNGCLAPNVISVVGSSPVITGATTICKNSITQLSSNLGTWSSSNPAVAVVTSYNGSVLGVSSGTSIISFTSLGTCGSAFKIITVRQLPDTFNVSTPLGNFVELHPGDTGVHVILSGSQSGVNYWLYHSGTTTPIAYFSGTGASHDFGLMPAGLLYEVNYYSVNASFPDSTCPLFMPRSAELFVTSPGFINAPPKMCVGSTSTFAHPISGGNWVSSNPAVATIVSGTGLLTSVSVGTSIISYNLTTGGYITTTLTVVNTISAISGRKIICQGETTQLSCLLGSWSSSSTSVASIVTSTGLVTSVNPGTAIISFTSAGGCGVMSCTVNVNSTPQRRNFYYFEDSTYGFAVICYQQPGFHPHVSATDIGINYWYNYRQDYHTQNFVSQGTGGNAYFGIDEQLARNIIVSSVYAVDPISGCNSIQHYNGRADVYFTPLIITGSTALCAGRMTNLSDSLDYYPGMKRWSSSNSAVLSVVDDSTYIGTVKGVSAGTAVITYTYFTALGNCYRTHTMTVNPSTCTGTPMPGTTSAVFSTICDEFDTVNLTGYSIDCGNNLQWQVSTDSLTWTDIPGAIQDYLVKKPLRTSWYRCKVTCVSSGLFAYSTVTRVTVKYGIADAQIINQPDTFCSSSHFYLKGCGVYSTYNVTTLFGDGLANNLPLSDTGISQIDVYHDYALPGTYTVKQILYNGLVAVDSVSFSYESIYCRTLPIKFFFDANSNCLVDSGEDFVFQPIRVAIDSNGIILDTVSMTGGLYYQSYGHPGTVYGFHIVSVDSSMLVVCPSSGVLYDTITSSRYIYPVKYMGYNCGSSTSFNLGGTAATFSQRIISYGSISVTNPYCQAQNTIVTMAVSPRYVFRSSTPAPSSIVGNNVTWNLGLVSSVQSRKISYYLFDANNDIIAGDTVQWKFHISPIVGDLDTTNNYLFIIDTIRSSFDPNEITVTPAANVLPCTPLEYTIKFENTGNAHAENIYVMDTLPAGLDFHSVQIKAVSALMNIVYINDGGYNILKFDFPGIKLKDSSHHNECDGFVTYTIKTLPGLPIGTQLRNRAGIYFDDNRVVMTNSVINTIGISPIVGNPIVCMTVNDTLADATPGGVWTISGGSASVSGGVVSGIHTGTAIVTYTVSNACASLSTSKSLTIYPKLVPSVSINSLSGDTVCIDKDYSASTSIINGGASPKYKWQVNSNGSDTGSTYTYHPNNNDVVSVLLTSNAICAIPTTAIATKLVNTLAPSITVSAANNNKIGIGESDTLIAQLENAGKNPTYQWLINNQPVAGETHQIFVTNKLVNGDLVSCQVTCSDICGGTTIQGSLSVEVLPFHEGDVVLSPNPNKGVFTLEGLFETNITKVAVDIKDVLGRSAFSATIPTTNGYFKQMITLAHLSKGMYILTLNAGGVNMVKKFVVE